MIRFLILKCSECSKTRIVKAEEFCNFSMFPIECHCGNIPNVPLQKLFWVAENLKRIWRALPNQGIVIDHPATQLKRSIMPIKIKTIPFRLKHKKQSFYLRFDEDDTPYDDASVTLILDEEPPLQIPLRDYQHGPEPGWDALPELAYWTRRFNQETYELRRTPVVEIGFLAASAIHRKAFHRHSAASGEITAVP